VQVRELVEELDYCDEDAIVEVEINGTIHRVAHVTENSEGVILFVDTIQEEREMR
jgi:hypothetical protein